MSATTDYVLELQEQFLPIVNGLPVRDEALDLIYLGEQDRQWWIEQMGEFEAMYRLTPQDNDPFWKVLYQPIPNVPLAEQAVYSIQEKGVVWTNGMFYAHSSLLGLNPKKMPVHIKLYNEKSDNYVHFVKQGETEFVDCVYTNYKCTLDGKAIWLDVLMDDLFLYPVNTEVPTYLLGAWEASFNQLTEQFGKPRCLDINKVPVYWDVQFEDDCVGTIYQWKNPVTLEDLKENQSTKLSWNIGGSDPMAYYRMVSLMS